MTNTMRIVVNPNRHVRDDKGRLLTPGSALNVPVSAYWTRYLADGDISIARKPAPVQIQDSK